MKNTHLHWLKTWKEPWQAVNSFAKRFEYRRDDRGFEVGDRLHLVETLGPESPDEKTGRYLQCEVTYIARGPAFGIPDGYVVMSIDCIGWDYLVPENGQ